LHTEATVVVIRSALSGCHVTDVRRFDAGGMAALQAAFDEMNHQSGLVSELTPIDVMFPASKINIRAG